MRHRQPESRSELAPVVSKETDKGTEPARTSRFVVRRGSADPAVGWTAGLPSGSGLETFGRPGGKVRRPCHNLVLDCENSGTRFPARS